MGLDQNWFSTKEPVPAPEIRAEYYKKTGEGMDLGRTELYDHRKVPALEQFMAEHWNALEGNEDLSFNCEYMQVDRALLKELEQALDHNDLDTHASGFFWGEHLEEDVDEIREAITEARRALISGHLVYYTSWW